VWTYRQSVDKVWTKCGQSVVKIKDRIGDFTWRVSECEELVGVTWSVV